MLWEECNYIPEFFSYSYQGHIVNKTSHFLMILQFIHRDKNVYLQRVHTQYSNSASEAHSLHLCVWVFDHDVNWAVALLNWPPTEELRQDPLAWPDVTPVPPDDPMWCWNNAAGTVYVTVNAGYSAASLCYHTERVSTVLLFTSGFVSLLFYSKLWN